MTEKAIDIKKDKQARILHYFKETHELHENNTGDKEKCVISQIDNLYLAGVLDDNFLNTLPEYIQIYCRELKELTKARQYIGNWESIERIEILIRDIYFALEKELGK